MSRRNGSGAMLVAVVVIAGAVGCAKPTPNSVSCSNADPGTLPIDSGGWVARECNNRNVQGAWYCYDDMVNSTSCVDGQPPYDAAANGMCLSGTTTLDSTYAAWGSGIGLTLNQSGTVSSTYDATANGVVGFRLNISGNTGGNALRVAFKGDPAAVNAPFVQFPGAGTLEATIASAMVPSSWGGPEAGTRANASAIYDLQVQLVGAERASSYSFCITGVTPIVADTSGAGGQGGGGGQGGAGGTGGSTDPCQPDCLGRLHGGCPAMGACMYQTGVTCWSNGVTRTVSGAGSSARTTISKNGMVCATIEVTSALDWPYVYTARNASGMVLGTLALYADGAQTVTCNGESPVTIPATCSTNCTAGTCN
jgi:hypothetical protein